MNKTLIALALALGSLQASAAVLDFESLAHDDMDVVDAGYVYQEAGFQLENLGSFPFATFGSQDALSYVGSTALFNDNDDGPTTLTRIGGGAFSLVSMDLAEMMIGDLPFSVTFSGLTSGGDVVTQAFTLDGSFGAQTFTFNSSFADVTSVSWANTAGYTQFDNISAVAAVPEPETYAMMLAGLGCLAGLRRRAKQA